MNNKIFFFFKYTNYIFVFYFSRLFYKIYSTKILKWRIKSFKQSERIQDSLIKAFLVRNKIFMSDFMVVTKSLITMHPDVLTSSSYIYLKAENSLYLKNQRS